ncbi:MAG: sulfatase [Verrucomicrobiales bacterium]|nr:sulfatase [Verrucomicrobiales bacterium]
MIYRSLLILFVLFSSLLNGGEKQNVLFIISDDLTSTALGCYGNTLCKTPNIDRLATQGTLFTRAYCQATFCGPSRASLMFGYYPYASKASGYTSGRKEVGEDKDSWAQHFKKNGYHSARISKVFHMGVPPDITKGSDGADDPESWNEAYNSKGPETKVSGLAEQLSNNPGGLKKGTGSSQSFNVVAAEGDDLVHSDGKTAQKAVELLHKYKDMEKPFFLAVGFVRPHVPLVAPKKYFAPYPLGKIVLPPKIPGDQDDIPQNSANKRTTANYKMDLNQQKGTLRAYYASVSFVDALVGKILTALEATGQRDNTIVIFTSDHGYHLGEHDMWQKVSIHEESAKVPLIICVPGKKPAVCHSLAELIDLYPTVSKLCDLKIPGNIQGKDISGMLDNPAVKVRDAALSSGKGRLLRTENWAFLDYGKSGELYDMEKDPKQYVNLIDNPAYAETLATMKAKLKDKLTEISKNDLGGK